MGHPFLLLQASRSGDGTVRGSSSVGGSTSTSSSTIRYLPPTPSGLAFHFETSKTPSFAVRLLSNIRRHQFGPLSFVSAAIRMGMEVSEVVRVLVARLQLPVRRLLHIPLLSDSPSSFQTSVTPIFAGLD
ncbi:hypothetical protein K443DRAFT_13952 [Laccaria amethystina LaAM-08-1]|uniref:Uncharacterized protein n=1 Tax=Laccaria amethystina LaAM-08-1 TaxID=1095629 RepID=A0A0C9WHY2_9AGAR|nr:hypothetical protein K443DRAFT_13952 [Laccaria amethystina LaAM-08-1]